MPPGLPHQPLAMRLWLFRRTAGESGPAGEGGGRDRDRDRERGPRRDRREQHNA